MIPLAQYNSQKIGVLGLGISGCAVLAALLAGGAEVYAWDDNITAVEGAKRQYPQIHYQRFDKWPWQQLNNLVLSPGIPLTYPKPHLCVTMATMNGCRIVGDIELLQEAAPEARYVAITGTNGKSTTTELIGHILKKMNISAQVGGNIGRPALALQPQDKAGLYVLELSSYQLDLLSAASFNIAVLLNITPDHLDRHGGIDGYVAAKRRIFAGQKADDLAIINVDDEYCKAIYDELKSGRDRFIWQQEGAQIVPISTQRILRKGVYVKDGIIHDMQDDVQVDINSFANLRGHHNWQNAAAAYLVCKAIIGDVSHCSNIAEAMASFGGLKHRLELVATIGNVQYINDSKATNVAAVAGALQAYDDIYWILGGRSKGDSLADLKPYFHKVKYAYLIGESADCFAQILKEHNVKYILAGDLPSAFTAANKDAHKAGGGNVLLSPACSAFDQFANFVARGEQFTKLVRAAEIKNKLGVKPSDATTA